MKEAFKFRHNVYRMVAYSPFTQITIDTTTYKVQWHTKKRTKSFNLQKMNVLYKNPFISDCEVKTISIIVGRMWGI